MSAFGTLVPLQNVSVWSQLDVQRAALSVNGGDWDCPLHFYVKRRIMK